MYDPARDTFTTSAGAPAAEETPAQPRTVSPKAKPLAQKDNEASPRQSRKRAASPSELEPEPQSERVDHASPSKSRKRAVSPSESSHKRTKLAPARRSTPPPRQRSPHSKDQTPTRARRSPPPRRRSPTPPPRSPPRERKRPGAASRIAAAEKEALRHRQIEREADQISSAQAAAATRGVHDVVRQHYNAVPQRGRDWRQTGSRIKGLRNYNNWVKSTLIQKFSPNEGFVPGGRDTGKGLLVLDIGCGKGGDLGKWAKAPQRVELYVGIDPAEVSIEQARTRYAEMRGRGGRNARVFQGEFYAADGYGEWIGDIPLIREVGIDGNVGPGGGGSARWGGGGFDVVTMMFCMHYAFETEAKARGMLRNVAGALKKGGRLIGVIPNSDVLRNKVEAFHTAKAATAKTNGDANGASIDDSPSAPTDSRNKVEAFHTAKAAAAKTNGDASGESKDDIRPAPTDDRVDDPSVPEWGNSLYRVRFPGATPADGVFRPPFGWKYSYFMAEAVEEVPEYVVPWEAFRALAEDYNLEMQYRRPFADIWAEEKDDPVLGPLSVRMQVRGSEGGAVQLTREEWEAVGFYHAFCFYKV
ncbi:mRNA cap guanine-N7 methyltransferase [Xylographa carneopallida]|nr:mRNA cap guanine-N7 methyltransferase [Xylographa carneopallida]